MKLIIISPSKKIYEGVAERVLFPGKSGQFEVLDNHAPLMALLDKGEIIINSKKHIEIIGGAVQVLPDKVRVLIQQ